MKIRFQTDSLTTKRNQSDSMKLAAFTLLMSIGLVFFCQLPVAAQTAQSLTFEQLVSLLSKNDEDAGFFLINKGWNPDKIDKNEYGHQINWSFDKKQVTGKEHITLQIGSNVTGEHYLRYWSTSDVSFRTMRNHVTSLGLKRISYDDSGSQIIYEYEGANYIVSFVTTIGGKLKNNTWMNLRTR